MAFVLYSTFLFALQITFYHTEAMPTTDYVAKMPDNCRNQTFCTKDGNYPQAIVDDLLKNNNLLSYTISVNPRIAIGNRQGEVNPCEPERVWRRDIHYIIDEHKDVRVVVQSMDRFRQLIPIRKCKSQKPTGDDANMAMIDMGKTYQANIECVENKFNFNFVVLSQDLKSLELARIINGGVPVGCQCRYVE